MTPKSLHSCTVFPFAPAHEESNIERVVSGPSLPSAPVSEVETAALHALKEELSNIPHDEKSSLVHAQRIQPDLVNDDHLMNFLWSEDFDVNLAVKRLVRYWEYRCKVFGPDQYTLPITLDGAMKDHIRMIEQVHFTLLPVLDDDGRAILYNSSSYYNEPNSRSADEKIRVWWYLMHVAMGNPNVMKNGFVVLSNSRYGKLKDFDPKFTLAACYFGDFVLPIRWRMAHICHIKGVFSIVKSALRAVLSAKQRESFVLHNGTTEEVVDSLSLYSLPKHCIPSDLGGTLCVPRSAFVRDRLAIESGASELDKDVKERTPPSQCVTEEAVSNALSILGSTDTACIDMFSCNTYQNDIKAKNTKAKATIPNSSATAPVPRKVVSEREVQSDAAQKISTKKVHREDEGNQRKKPGAAKKAAADDSKTHPGRSGDMRMNLAVQAKIGDPTLSLVKALIAGGFVFPNLSAPGVKVSEVKDTNNVSLYQRRNQLLRRLRFIKKKSSET